MVLQASDSSTDATMPSDDADAPTEAQTDAVGETDAFEELQQAAFDDDGESLKPPGLAALDASMLDVPGNACCIAQFW